MSALYDFIRIKLIKLFLDPHLTRSYLKIFDIIYEHSVLTSIIISIYSYF